MKLTFNVMKIVLFSSTIYSVFLLGHKIFFEPSPSEYDQSMSNTLGVSTNNYPGFLTGIASGFVAPLANLAGFILGFFSGSQVPHTTVGLIIFYPFLSFSAYGDPQFHFGVLYDIGFIIGIFLVVPAILAIGLETNDLPTAN